MDTWLLEFRLKQDDCKEFVDDILKKLDQLVVASFPDCSLVYKTQKDGFLMVFNGNSGTSVLVHGKSDGLLVIDINRNETDLLDFEENVRKFEAAVRGMKYIKKLPTPGFVSLPSLKRGRPFSHYDTTTGLLIERDFDRVVFDDVSPYQHVRIMHSPQYGNCLYLDNDLNLAESDLEYTRAITGYDNEDYKGKDVLILGGGDGGILHHLKPRGPAMITMIDIDQMVIDAAKVHLRGICHDALDSLEGENYEIIVDDCVKYLVQFVEKGRKFDYIINDLTGIPVSAEPVGSYWDFMRSILSLSMKVLKDDGKYFTQGNSQMNPRALKMYEKQLGVLNCPVKFKTEVVCVPSYLENWVFYTIWKDT